MKEAIQSQAAGLLPVAGAAAGRARGGGRPLTIAVTSGKGGVGKTNVVANTAALLAAEGLRVFVIDADFGLANLAVVLNVVAGRTLEDALEGRCALADTLVTPRPGLRLVPAGSGVRRLAALSPHATRALLDSAERLAADADIVLVDTAAGIAPSVLETLAWVDEVAIVLADDPASFVDAYALTKLVSEQDPRKPLGLLVNRVRTRQDGEAIQRNLARVAERFLGRAPTPLGVIIQDPRLIRAVRSQRLVSEDDPTAPSSRALKSLADRLGAACRSCLAVAG